MGDCYSVYFKGKIKNPVAFVQKSKAFIHAPHWTGGLKIAPECYEKGDETTPRGILGILFAEVNQPYGFTVLEGTRAEENIFEVNAGFDATYTWGAILEGWWNEIEDTLEEGAIFEVDADETKFNFST